MLIVLSVSGYMYFFSKVRVPYAIAETKLVIKYPDKYEQYRTVKCNSLNFFEPGYAFIGKRPERDHEIFFFNVSSKEAFFMELNPEYTGGTTIKNATFDELVAMVKDDCEQFKEARGDFRDTTINWSYGKYEPEPEKTPEEIEREDLEKKLQEIEDINYVLEEIYTDEKRNNVIEKYGDWKELSDKELVKWYLEGPGKRG